MIDKLQLCAEQAALIADKVVIGDSTIHNIQSDSGSGSICFISLPRSKKRANVQITESTTIVVSFMKRSVFDTDFSDEMNILNDCELLANKFVRSIRCKADQYDITADCTVKLKETDNLLSGIEATISFEPI